MYKTFIMSIVGLYADKNSRDNNPESRVYTKVAPKYIATDTKLPPMSAMKPLKSD